MYLGFTLSALFPREEENINVCATHILHTTYTSTCDQKKRGQVRQEEAFGSSREREDIEWYGGGTIPPYSYTIS
jgi:hypothetical protein